MLLWEARGVQWPLHPLHVLMFLTPPLPSMDVLYGRPLGRVHLKLTILTSILSFTLMTYQGTGSATEDGSSTGV